MSDEALVDEITRLRAEVESHRQRELADLKAALSIARVEADHFRAEAYRNADAARQLVTGYEAKLTEMKSKYEALKNSGVYDKRFGSPARN